MANTITENFDYISFMNEKYHVMGKDRNDLILTHISMHYRRIFVLLNLMSSDDRIKYILVFLERF